MPRTDTCDNSTHQAGKHLEEDGRVPVVDDAAPAHVGEALGAGELHFRPPVPLDEGDDVPDEVAAVVGGARDLGGNSMDFFWAQQMAPNVARKHFKSTHVINLQNRAVGHTFYYCTERQG